MTKTYHVTGHALVEIWVDVDVEVVDEDGEEREGIIALALPDVGDYVDGYVVQSIKHRDMTVTPIEEDEGEEDDEAIA